MRFGNSVTSLEDSPRGVEVTLREGEAQTFDLVIGADGLHSAVRRLCFGEETRFEHFLGYYVAAFTAQGYRFRDPDAYVTYGEPGRQIWRITVDEETTVFMLVFAESDSHEDPVHGASRQKDVLTCLYAGGSWETGSSAAEGRSEQTGFVKSGESQHGKKPRKLLSDSGLQISRNTEANRD